MIVEPVPTLPTSRRRRLVRRTGIAMPALALMAIVAGGMLGSATDLRPVDATASPASSRPAVAPRPTVAAGWPVTDMPSVVADLVVRTVPEALAVRGGLGTDDVVAVAGDLAVTPASCPGATRAGFGPLCERQGTLAEGSSPRGATADPAVSGGAHLDLRIPAGVAVPPAVARYAPSDPSAYPGGPTRLPSVIVGRFERGGETCPTRLECDIRFLVDRVMWAGGSGYPVQLVVGPGVDSSPAEWIQVHKVDAETAAVGWSGTLLVTALLRPPTVALVDPAAAQAMDAAVRPAGLVWYVRGLETDYDPTRYPLGQSPPRLSWALLDDVTDQVIARGWAR